MRRHSAPARLAAYYAAMVELLDGHADLVLGAETGGSRFATDAHGFWYLHVRSLLVTADVGEPDAMVDPLLAPLAAEIYRQQRERKLTSAQITAALTGMARAVLR